ncbi:MAG: hypothetical protein J2P37_10300 [Ktedonobacteraceae bacterium]|nr:hypothetical protein [Ktedonobacteraceae bacterium]
MEQKKPRTYHDEFAEQFIALMYEQWLDILLVASQQSPRVASLLRVAAPVRLQRTKGMWRIQVATRSSEIREKLRQPRDNEILAQAIRLYYHREAQLKLPRISVDFDE